jgi:23S rRNA (pseudouridine1915-N3)-methyltransferase
VVGKTDAAYLKTGIEVYEKRLKNYIPFEMQVVPEVKHAGRLPEPLQREREGEAILARLEETDFVALLDERGSEFSSRQFAGFLERQMSVAARRLVFVIGGPYGFDERVRERARANVSLSKMTFSHQMVRLIFLEQLYRAMTIWRGEPYHHE